jgi:hypothetical protein
MKPTSATFPPPLPKSDFGASVGSLQDSPFHPGYHELHLPVPGITSPFWHFRAWSQLTEVNGPPKKKKKKKNNPKHGQMEHFSETEKQRNSMC